MKILNYRSRLIPGCCSVVFPSFRYHQVGLFCQRSPKSTPFLGLLTQGGWILIRKQHKDYILPTSCICKANYETTHLCSCIFLEHVLCFFFFFDKFLSMCFVLTPLIS